MTITQKQYDISGMHCKSCVTKITNALEELDAVESAEVTLSPPKAVVRLRGEIDDDRLNSAVEKAGDYHARPASNEGAAQEPTKATAETSSEEPKESLYPLLLIVGFIAGVTILIAVRNEAYAVRPMMNHFMAGFFIVFGFFKLLDLRGFANMYGTYDLVAKAVPPWAWIYPFVEVALGAMYLLDWMPITTNVVTLILMLIGAAGVATALMNKRQIRCACLGSVLNLPMTTVTLVEDLGMAAMAAAMLILDLT